MWFATRWSSMPNPDVVRLRHMREAAASALEMAAGRTRSELDENMIPNGQGGLWMVECKASKTVQPSMAGSLGSLRRAMGDQAPVRASVVHRTSTTAPLTRALVPGIEALDVPAFVVDLNGRSGRSPNAGPRRSRKPK